jgi:hypothetical protein
VDEEFLYVLEGSGAEIVAVEQLVHAPSRPSAPSLLTTPQNSSAQKKRAAPRIAGAALGCVRRREHGYETDRDHSNRSHPGKQ